MVLVILFFSTKSKMKRAIDSCNFFALVVPIIPFVCLLQLQVQLQLRCFSFVENESILQCFGMSEYKHCRNLWRAQLSHGGKVGSLLT